MEDSELRKLFQEMFGDFSDHSIQPAVPQKPQPQPAPGPQTAQSAAPKAPDQPPLSRFFMKKFRGTANYVENHTNAFFEEMAQEYPTFQVVSTAAVELPDSICLFLTYHL